MVAANTCSSSCAYGLASTTAYDIYTVAGNGSGGYSGDGGPALSAGLDAQDVSTDASGNLLIANYGIHRLRIVASATCTSSCAYGLANTTAEDIYTVAGSGSTTYSGDAGPALSAQLNPQDVIADAAGNLLVSDYGSNRVRLVAASACTSSCAYGLSSTTAGDIYTVAGNGIYGYSGDGGPATSAEIGPPGELAIDGAGDLLIGDSGNAVVRLVAAGTCASSCPYGLPSMTAGDIYTVVGTGTYGYSGDGGPAKSAELASPFGVAVDAAGDLVVADNENYRVRLVAGSTCASACPYGLSSTTAGDIYTVAGNGTESYSGDGGPGTSAEIGYVGGVATDASGDVLIADAENSRVRLLAAGNCSSSCPYGLGSTTAGDIYTVAGNGTDGFSGDSGPASAAELRFPDGVAVDAPGDVLIADDGSNRVRLLAASACSSSCPYGLPSTAAGDIYTVAGDGAGGIAGDGGPATSAALSGPFGVGIDNSTGDLLVADGTRVRAVSTTGVTVSGAGVGSLGLIDYPGIPPGVGTPTFSGTGSYFDLRVAGGSFSSVAVQDCNLDGGNAMQWWNPAAGGAGAWQPVMGDPGPTFAAGPPACLGVTLDASSSPSLAQFVGTVFAVPGPPAAAGGGSGIPSSNPTATTTSLTSTPNPSAVSQPVTYTATVAPAPDGGTLSFTDAGSPIAGCEAVTPTADGTATCAVVYTTPGAHTIDAAYSGDAGFAPSTATSLTEVVQAAGAPGPSGVCAGAQGNPAFVCAAYHHLLGRAPDAGGLATYVGLMTGGASRAQIAADVVNSPEYRGDLVQGYYQAFLGRAADTVGLGTWTTALARGASGQAVEAGLLSSPEFWGDSGSTPAGFVSDLYEKVLGRAPDPGGLRGWEAVLASGTGRAGVVMSLLNSGEARAHFVQAQYQALLGRPADPAGLSLWLTQLSGGSSYQNVISGIVGSAEFFGDSTA